MNRGLAKLSSLMPSSTVAMLRLCVLGFAWLVVWLVIWSVIIMVMGLIFLILFFQ